jgi:diguanylate cyclase (GGDEF)-like protein
LRLSLRLGNVTPIWGNRHAFAVVEIPIVADRSVAYLQPSHDPWLVIVSVLVAMLASYVALDLASRVRDRDRFVALCWGLGGSLAMGSGIWAMHFVGMLALTLPITLGFTEGLTALSWLAAVIVSGIALSLASRGSLTLARLVAGSLAMGLGICAMHYIGMAALDMAPGIEWQPGLVALSAVIAVAASGGALGVFVLLHGVAGAGSRRHQLAAAGVMGVAISGTHYTGMAAAAFPAGSVCLSAGALGGSLLGLMVVMGAVALLTLTLFTSTLDGRLRSRSHRLATSLRVANQQLTAANASLQTLAFRDSLTGLANRLLFDDRLKQAVQRVDDKVGSCRLAVLFVDLDGFKPVNDSWGHVHGDELLRQAAQRLLLLARNGDTLARVGGDEFVLLIEDAGTPASCLLTAQRIVDALGAPFSIGEHALRLSASVGIVLYPDHGDAARLLAHADAAMYAAKRSGGNCCTLFEPRMDGNALDQLSLQSALRQAIERQELRLYYQPKIDVRTGAVAGVEALMRWQHPQRGLVSPAVFIPVAERFGLINALGQWVIDESCRQMAEWAEAGHPQKVAINISVYQLRHGDLATRIESALKRYGVPPSALLCEITESGAMDDLQASRQAFDDLVRIGVYLSIDDFGTGYSSLSYLRRLPARQLKIDRSFVNDLETSADARAVVLAVLSVAHALSLRVVAEGVETAGQRDVLSRMGCDELQGYFYAKPMPARQLMAWIAEREPLAHVA